MKQDSGVCGTKQENKLFIIELLLTMTSFSFYALMDITLKIK